MSPNLLRNIPSVGELLESPKLKGLVDRISHNTVVDSVRAVLDEVRTEFQTVTTEISLPSVSELADRIARRVLESQTAPLKSVVNATGVVLPGGMGRAPLAESAAQAMAAVASDYANVEIDLATGKHRRRIHAVEGLLKNLTGAEAATALNNTAGALMATLAALAAGQQVVISRGQMIEMGCSYRLPEVLAAAGVTPCEVGTTNKTRLSDYAEAITEATAAVLIVRPSNFQQTGAAGEPAATEIIELAHKHKLPVIVCLGYGALVDLAPMGLPDAPVVAKCVAAGADLVMASGDKLIGGPQCGIVAGRRKAVDRVQAHPLARALRLSPPMLAALAATLDLYGDAEKARREIPLLELLSTSVDNLRNRAERLAPQIRAAGAVQSAEVVEGTTSLAGYATDCQQLASCSIAVEPQAMTADRLAGLLRQGSPPVMVRVEGERVVLDLRSVLPRHDIRLVEAIEAVSPAPAEKAEEKGEED